MYGLEQRIVILMNGRCIIVVIQNIHIKHNINVAAVLTIGIANRVAAILFDLESLTVDVLFFVIG